MSAEPAAPDAAPEEPVRPAGRRRILLRLIFLAILCGLTLASVELALVVFGADTRIRRGYRDGGLLMPYDPGSAAEVLAPEFRVRYDINSFGFRDRPRALSPPEGVLRGLLIGDSFTEGWGVDREERYGDRLEDALPQLELLNAAANGGCQVQHLFQVRQTAPRFGARFVLLQVYDNDPLDNWNLMPRVSRDDDGAVGELPEDLAIPERGALERLDEWWEDRELRRRWKLFKRKVIEGKQVNRNYFVKPGARSSEPILTRAQAIERFDGPEQRRLGGGPEPTLLDVYQPSLAETWAPRLEVTEALLRQIIAEARERAIALAVIYIPDRRVFLPENRALAEANPLRARLRAVCEETGTALMDFQGAWMDDPEVGERYYVFDGHWTARGHADAAAALQPWLTDWLSERGLR